MSKKLVIGALIALFICASFVPSIGGDNEVNNIISSESYTATSTIFSNEGTLSGYVNDTLMNPIEEALVRVYFHGTYEENYSDSSGYYHVTNIPICWCLKNATASKEGYTTEWILLSIAENTTYDFVLTPITEPELDIEIAFKFGKTCLVIRNIGDGDAYNVTWGLNITGGIFGFIDEHLDGTRDILQPGDEIVVPLPSIFGLGPLRIEVVASALNADIVLETWIGIIIFFFYFLFP